jgi:hypothetical protein
MDPVTRASAGSLADTGATAVIEAVEPESRMLVRPSPLGRMISRATEKPVRRLAGPRGETGIVTILLVPSTKPNKVPPPSRILEFAPRS